jgi:hypothetical protein
MENQKNLKMTKIERFKRKDSNRRNSSGFNNLIII